MFLRAMPGRAKYLLEQVANGDEVAFRHLYRIYSGALYGVILASAASERSACDALERTFIRIWRNEVAADEKCTLMQMIRIAKFEALAGKEGSVLTTA